MKNIEKIIILFSVIVLFFSVALTANAQGQTGLFQGGLKEEFDKTLDFVRLAPGFADVDPSKTVPPSTAVIALVLNLISVIFFILILYSGFQWMTASGNEEKVTSAKKRIVSATIGLIVTLCAYLIAFTVFKFLYKEYLKEPPGGLEPPPAAQGVIPCNGSGEVVECADRSPRIYCVDGNCVQCRDNDDCPSGTQCNLSWHSCLRSAETSCTEIENPELCLSQSCKWITEGRWQPPEGRCVENNNPCPQCSEDAPVCVSRGEGDNKTYSCEECVDEARDPNGEGTRGACKAWQTCMVYECLP